MHILLDVILKPACNTHMLKTYAMLYTFTNIYIPPRVTRTTWEGQLPGPCNLRLHFYCVVYVMQYELKKKKKSKSLPPSLTFSLEMDSRLCCFTAGWWPAMSRSNILLFGCVTSFQRCAVLPHWLPHVQHTRWRLISTKCKNLEDL